MRRSPLYPHDFFVLKAVNDEQLANKAYVRAKDLYEHGADSLAMLEQAEDTEKDMQADLVAAEQQLKTLGVDKNHPSSVVPVLSTTKWHGPPPLRGLAGWS